MSLVNARLFIKNIPSPRAPDYLLHARDEVAQSFLLLHCAEHFTRVGAPLDDLVILHGTMQKEDAQRKHVKLTAGVAQW